MKNLLFIFILIPFVSLSQFGNQDFGIWSSMSVDKEIIDNLQASGDLQIRLDDNSSRINQYFIDLGAKYKINKYLKAGLSWRNRMVNKLYDYEYQNRLYFDVTGKYKFGDIAVFLRNRFQTTTEKNDLNAIYNRFRLKVEFKLQKGLVGFIQDELFYHLNGTGTSNYKKNRFGLGFEYKINKDLNLNLKYLRITDVNSYYPLKMNVVALGVNYEL